MRRNVLRAISLAQRYYNRFLSTLCGSKGLVLVFHEVDNSNTHCVEASSFCSIDLFKDTLDKYAGQFCSIGDFVGGKNGVVITFDDVPESVLINAVPLLQERNVPFTLYVSPKFIDKEGFLNREQILELSKNPLCTIGAHTMNHTKLREEKDSYSDILDSKTYLEKLIDKPVEHLAYPYGRADSISCKVRREAKKAGFISAVCTIPTKVPQMFDRYYIPRVAFY